MTDQNKNSKTLTGDTIIELGKSIPLAKYRAYFRKVIKDFAPEVFCGNFQSWLNTHTGKTLKQAVEAYYTTQDIKNMEEILTEERFNIISEQNKAFIIAFDKEIGELDYDFGGKIGSGFCWGPYMIIWSKVGVKAKKVVTRIFIRENGIILRLFFNKIDDHRAYIENAPEHIKNVFLSGHGDCSCNPKKENCNFRKSYEIDGKPIEKCSGVVFEFWEPNLLKLRDYMDLLKEFYASKRK